MLVTLQNQDLWEPEKHKKWLLHLAPFLLWKYPIGLKLRRNGLPKTTWAIVPLWNRLKGKVNMEVIVDPALKKGGVSYYTLLNRQLLSETLKDLTWQRDHLKRVSRSLLKGTSAPLWGRLTLRGMILNPTSESEREKTGVTPGLHALEISAIVVGI